jgi:phosphate transport system substrate-binding protein
MTLWAEGFEAIYPNVNIQIEGKGSSTAPPALIEGTAQIGPMSREMKGSEMDAFEARYGYKPTAVGTSIDALAVFVNKDNPLANITSEQIDSVFSSTYRKGGTPVTEWSQLGLEGSLGNRAISLYGRNSASGTYGFFKKVALAGGDFSSSVKEQPGSSSVVQGIGSDLAGIGYSGIGYTTSGVKAIQIDGVEPIAENCLDGSYPLARQLFVYVNRDPRQPMDKLTYEFLRFVLSKQGQEVVQKDGYFPLPAPIAEQILNSLQ